MMADIFSRLIRKVEASLAAGDRTAAIADATSFWAKNTKSLDVFLWTVTTLIDLGEDQRALDVVGQAFQAQGENAAILRVMGELGLRMDMPHVAVQAYRKACALEPGDKESHVHLATALSKQEETDAAIELLSAQLEKAPEYAPYWNCLANLLKSQGRDYRATLHFYDEAIRLEPENPTYLHNRALMGHLSDECKPYYLRALDLAPDNSQIRLSYALYLMARLEVEEGLEYYEARLDPELGSRAAAKYTHNLPEWTGEPLAGKSIFVYAEQGIGDEVFFTAFVRHLGVRGAQVYIGCDPRLVRLYEHSDLGFAGVFEYQDTRDHRYKVRSFPLFEEKLASGELAVDYAVPVASIPHRCGMALDDILNTSGKFLQPVSPAPALPGCADGRPRVGIAWRSGNVKGIRANYYLDVTVMRALATSLEADFYVLQYAFSDDERALLADLPNVHFFDLDLKADIEANISILSCLDICVSPPIATAMFAAATGTKVCMVNNGPPWTFFGDQPRPGLFPAGSGFVHLRNVAEGRFKTTEEVVTDICAYITAAKG
jgi:tetratricopeptide (TPR) repeat protein